MKIKQIIGQVFLSFKDYHRVFWEFFMVSSIMDIFEQLNIQISKTTTIIFFAWLFCIISYIFKDLTKETKK